MATLSVLQQELQRKEAEETRLRAEYESFTTRIQEIFSQEGPLEIELRQQRSIIQDANATQAQKDAALDRALGLEQELRVLENQITRLRDQQSAFQRNQLTPLQQEIYGPGGLQEQVRRAETQQSAQADQGPKTDSAGETASGSQQANADGANSQAPSGSSQQANATGEVSAASAATVPSNADQTQALPTEPVDTPPKLPAGNVSTSDGFRIDIQGVAPQPVALQVSNPEISALEENNNLVSYIYQATQVISRFQGGKFTQDIEGVQIFFPPNASGTKREVPARAAPVDQSQAETQRLQNVARSQTQQTVAVTAATPGEYNSGVSYANQVGAEFAAFEGSGEIPESTFNRTSQTVRALPSSSFAAEGFVDPTAINDESEIPTVAPLRNSPPTVDGASVGTSSGSAQTDAANGVLGLQSRLRSAQTELAENQRLLSEIEQKIANNQGDPRLNSELRNLYKNNIQRLQGTISQIQTQLASRSALASSDINTALQRGAREY
jgi:hypothetical protein